MVAYLARQGLHALSGETRTYCGYEYALANLRFAMAVKPESAALCDRLRHEQGKRDRGLPTGPPLLADELSTVTVKPMCEIRAGGATLAARRGIRRALRGRKIGEKALLRLLVAAALDRLLGDGLLDGAALDRLLGDGLLDAGRRWGRLVADAPDKMRSRPRALGAPGKPKPVRQPRLRKPKHFRAERPGHCVALDSIEVRALSERRYLITCTDLHSHFAWAWATRSHASAAAAQFFRLIQAVFPSPSRPSSPTTAASSNAISPRRWPTDCSPIGIPTPRPRR